MSTAQCEIGIVRIRVGLINDILRFNYKYSTIFSFRKFKYHLFLSAFGSTQCVWVRVRSAVRRQFYGEYRETVNIDFAAPFFF